MPRGGKRPGSGPKKGTKYRRRFQLEVEGAKPETKPTAAERSRQMKRRVALAVHEGFAPEKIASLLGLDLEKLKALFGYELEHGHELIRLTELETLAQASETGNVAASKAILSRQQHNGEKQSADQKRAKTQNSRVNDMALVLLKGGKT